MLIQMNRSAASDGRSSKGDAPHLWLDYVERCIPPLVQAEFTLSAGRGEAQFRGFVQIDEFLEWVGEGVVPRSGASNTALIALARRCMDELAKRSAPGFDAEDYRNRELYGDPEDEPEDEPEDD